VYIKFRYQFSVCKRLSQQSTNDKDRNGGSNNGGYGDAVVPVVPLPMMSGSPMYGSIPDGYGNVPNWYGNEPNVYTSGPSTTEMQNPESNAHKTKAHLSKHKHKHHSTKHHKTGKKALSIKVDKK
jgi:hypothetical protein